MSTTLATLTAGKLDLATLPPIPAADVTGLAAVATSGAYGDLTGAPSLTTATATATGGSDVTLSTSQQAVCLIADIQPGTYLLTCTMEINITTAAAGVSVMQDYTVYSGMVTKYSPSVSYVGASAAGVQSCVLTTMVEVTSVAEIAARAGFTASGAAGTVTAGSGTGLALVKLA